MTTRADVPQLRLDRSELRGQDAAQTTAWSQLPAETVQAILLTDTLPVFENYPLSHRSSVRRRRSTNALNTSSEVPKPHVGVKHAHPPPRRAQALVGFGAQSPRFSAEGLFASAPAPREKPAHSCDHWLDPDVVPLSTARREGFSFTNEADRMVSSSNTQTLPREGISTSVTLKKHRDVLDLAADQINNELVAVFQETFEREAQQLREQAAEKERQTREIVRERVNLHSQWLPGFAALVEEFREARLDLEKEEQTVLQTKADMREEAKMLEQQCDEMVKEKNLLRHRVEKTQPERTDAGAVTGAQVASGGAAAADRVNGMAGIDDEEREERALEQKLKEEVALALQQLSAAEAQLKQQQDGLERFNRESELLTKEIDSRHKGIEEQMKALEVELEQMRNEQIQLHSRTQHATGNVEVVKQELEQTLHAVANIDELLQREHDEAVNEVRFKREALLEKKDFFDKAFEQIAALHSKSLQFANNINVDLVCTSCFQLFRDPIIIWPCGHTFCQQCIGYDTTTEGKQVMQCPECANVDPLTDPELMKPYCHPYTVAAFRDKPEFVPVTNRAIESLIGVFEWTQQMRDDMDAKRARLKAAAAEGT